MAVSKILRLSLLLLLAACGGSPAAPTIEGTTFAPALDVQLSKSTRLPSGTYYRDLVVGTGAAVATGKIAVVHYTGWFTNGDVFDSNSGGAGFQFTDGAQQVISGWDKGLVGAQVGGTRQLIIPPDQAYGPNQYYQIPGNSILVFTVQIDVVE